MAQGRLENIAAPLVLGAFVGSVLASFLLWKYFTWAQKVSSRIVAAFSFGMLAAVFLSVAPLGHVKIAGIVVGAMVGFFIV